MSKSHSSNPTGFMRPGIACGHYPERPQTSTDWLQGIADSITGFARTGTVSSRKMKRIVHGIDQYGKLFEKLDDTGLGAKIQELRNQLHHHGITPDLTLQAFAVVREMAGRTLNMYHFDCQLMGGWVMIHGGLAEMETGEGKTLTATLAAATAALAGIPVHIITVNDYLVARDAEQMAPLYYSLGLSVGTITTAMSPAMRREGYSCDITYCTNKQIAFDYLRDRIALGSDHGRLRLQLEQLHTKDARIDSLFLRGLCFAIIDEADSVLIDEARTPLVISRERKSSDEEKTYRQAVEVAEHLQISIDFMLDQATRQVHLTEKGERRIHEVTRQFGGVWSGIRRREELVSQALSAVFLYTIDRHYLVSDDKVMIIDENTGRIMPDRSWERGLHQMIEIKEKCKVTGPRENIARLTYQRFFRRYLRLAGMTGTAQEVRRELWSVYRLPVLRIPTNKPSRRKSAGCHVFPTKNEKWQAVLSLINTLHQQGCPILIGTGSVADSEHLSNLLTGIQLEHQVLNARQDAHEAEIISKSGQNRAITVATNMAGRGTDIPLSRDVASQGGLYVIATETNDARRIDRQLFGRCGRQGDPGSYQSLLSCEDELIRRNVSSLPKNFLSKVLRHDLGIAQRIAYLLIRYAQAVQEGKNRNLRHDLLQQEEQLGKILAFSGRME